MFKAPASARWKQIQLDRNQPDQKKPYPVCRHRRCHKNNRPHDAVKHTILINGTEHSNRNAQYQNHHKRYTRKLQSRRKTAHQFARNCTARIDVTDSKISPQTVSQPGNISYQIWFVQSKFRPYLCHRFFCNNRYLADAQCHLRRIGWYQVNKHKTHKRNDNKKRNCRQDSFYDILFHLFFLYFFSPK